MRFYGSVCDRLKNPFKNIPVTDGRNIVFTDEEGRFDFEGWDDADILSLNLLTKGHDDWYFKVDGHKGSYDFEIRPADKVEDFTILHTSDTEIENEYDMSWVDVVKKAVIKTQCALFLDTGDLCRLDGMRRHYLATNYETLGCPVRYTPGNHDLNGKNYAEEYYEQYYGPCWYSFDIGKVHFIALSINSGETPFKHSPEDQWIWFEKDVELNRNKPLYVITHGEYKGPYQFSGKTYDPVKAGVKAWIYGHMHSNYSYMDKGMLNVCTNTCIRGGICSCEAALRELIFKDGKLTTRMLLQQRDDPEPGDYLSRLSLDENTLYCQPIHDKNSLYVGTIDDGWPKSCHIFKIDLNSNSVVWKYKTINGVKADMALFEDRLYFQDSQGNVCCLEAATGALIWQRHLDLLTSRVAYTKKGVLLVNGMLICGTEKALYALTPEDGTTIWCTSIPKSADSPARFVYDPLNRQLLVSAHWKTLYSVDINTGELLWQNGVVPLWFRSSTPAIIDGEIYTAGISYLCKLGLNTGAITQCVNTDEVFDSTSYPVTDGELVYYSSSTGGVFAVDKTFLKFVRHYPASANIVHTVPYVTGDAQSVESHPLLYKDMLIFGASDGFLYVYEKDTEKLIKKYYLGSPCLTTPIVLDDDKLLLVTMKGEVLTYSL
ncbi:MAG: hypothetical protein E7646_02190 [Ruminococcaceae bacterium]|nr:hypothetical protein [Oscillospiraceae bacterium]